MRRRINKRQTQRAAQYYVAAELARRGYHVSVPLETAKVSSLLVISPGNRYFTICVQAQSAKSFWPVPYREPQDDLFVVLVYLAHRHTPPQFYVLSSAELMQERQEYKLGLDPGNGEGDQEERLGGIPWRRALRHKSQWAKLPQ